MKAATFTWKKAAWKRMVKRALAAADDVADLHMRQRRVSMGLLYDTARKVQKAGVAGEELAGYLPFITEFRRPVVIEADMSATCDKLEMASTVLQNVCDVQRIPFVDFPAYESGLRGTSVQTATGLTALDELIKEASDETVD